MAQERRHGEYKVLGGKLVVADLDVVDGRLADVSVNGDFFLEPDEALEDINAALTGLSEHASPQEIVAAVEAALAPDVVFFPTARLIECGGAPTVVMVRNMEPLTVPFGGNTWREGFRNIARARVARARFRPAPTARGTVRARYRARDLRLKAGFPCKGCRADRCR